MMKELTFRYMEQKKYCHDADMYVYDCLYSNDDKNKQRRKVTMKIFQH